MGQLGEYVKMALKNIWANKVRTFLTMLGIIIGISSVILIISIGNGATGMISEQLGSIGKGQIAFYITDYQDKYYYGRRYGCHCEDGWHQSSYHTDGAGGNNTDEKR